MVLFLLLLSVWVESIFEKRKTVKIRDRYDVSVPTVVGPVSRPHSVFVEDAKFLQQQTKQPIK